MTEPIPTDQEGGDLAARVFFFIECAVNLIAAAQCFFTPQKFYLQFIPKRGKAKLGGEVGDHGSLVDAAEAQRDGRHGGDEAATGEALTHALGLGQGQQLAPRAPPVACALIAWYGVLLCGLTYMVLRGLIGFNDSALCVVFEGMLFGDVLHLGAAWLMARAAGGWAAANTAGVVITLFMMGWRIYFLALHYSYDVDGSGADWPYGRHR